MAVLGWTKAQGWDLSQMPTVSEEQRISEAVLRLNGVVLGFVFGIIVALIIFVATNWLVLKGGRVVGPHLGLLSQFFIGYKVTFLGSFIGAAYGFVLGFAGAWTVARVYNFIVNFNRRS